jgi:hypothetical protein
MGPAMMTSYAVWHGTIEDLKRLQEAIAHNCECKPPVAGYMGTTAPGKVCDAHRMLLDQKVLDHLVFVREWAMLYIEAEPEH